MIDKALNKQLIEDAVEKEMRELMQYEIFNNESFAIAVKKMSKVLEQLPEEPIDNEYLKELFLRVKRQLDLKGNEPTKK